MSDYFILDGSKVTITGWQSDKHIPLFGSQRNYLLNTCPFRFVGLSHVNKDGSISHKKGREEEKDYVLRHGIFTFNPRPIVYHKRSY